MDSVRATLRDIAQGRGWGRKCWACCIIYIYMFILIYIYIYIYVYTCMYIYIYIYMYYTILNMYVYRYIGIILHIYIYIRVHIYTVRHLLPFLLPMPVKTVTVPTGARLISSFACLRSAQVSHLLFKWNLICPPTMSCTEALVMLGVSTTFALRTIARVFVFVSERVFLLFRNGDAGGAHDLSPARDIYFSSANQGFISSREVTGLCSEPVSQKHPSKAEPVSRTSNRTCFSVSSSSLARGARAGCTIWSSPEAGSRTFATGASQNGRPVVCRLRWARLF